MTDLRTLLMSGALLCGAGVAPASAALIQVSDLQAATGHAVFANLNDAVGVTYAPGTQASYGSAAGAITFTSSSNVLERNDTASYLDNNFPSTQLINQCGYTGLFGCDPAGAVTIRFGIATTGFTVSADDFDTTAPYTFTATVFNGSTVLGVITASSLADSGSSPAVLAALSSTPITSVTITDPTGNFALASIGTVPEPASLALLATGALGVAGLRRRR